MVDVIANNQELLKMQKAAKTADILRKLDLDVNTYDLSDTSSENIQLMEDTKAKMSLAEAHASVCLKTGESCVLNKISYVPQRGESSNRAAKCTCFNAWIY